MRKSATFVVLSIPHRKPKTDFTKVVYANVLLDKLSSYICSYYDIFNQLELPLLTCCGVNFPRLKSIPA